MFLKKHSQPEWTPADRQRERLLLDYFATETNLEEKAKVAIVRKGVIDLYPDGPDKDRAIKDFEAAHEKDFEATARWAVPSVNISSHTIIEKVYRDFLAAR